MGEIQSVQSDYRGTKVFITIPKDKDKFEYLWVTVMSKGVEVTHETEKGKVHTGYIDIDELIEIAAETANKDAWAATVGGQA